MLTKNQRTYSLSSERIFLRRWQESDAVSLYKYASDPDVGPRAGWPPHQSVEESLTVIRDIFTNDTTWAIVLKETNETIGCMGYFTRETGNIPIGANDCEVGYWVGKPYWNQGFCTEALRLMLDYCINQMHFENIWSDHFTANPASGHVMEKCGFKDTGKLNRCSNLLGGDKDMVRIYKLDTKSQAIELALSVFMEFEAPEYSEEGIEEFKRTLNNPEYIDILRYYITLDQGEVVGMLATRNEGSHIALFFVNKNYHSHGIGRRLFEQAVANCPTQKMTVFSSPYAVKIYEALGFEATDTEQIDNGIRFTPMAISTTANQLSRNL